MYITSKSPDMQFDVCLLRKYMSKPTLLHLHETKRVNRYQRGTTESEIQYENGGTGDFLVYTDNDFTGDIDINQKQYFKVCLSHG